MNRLMGGTGTYPGDMNCCTDFSTFTNPFRLIIYSGREETFNHSFHDLDAKLYRFDTLLKCSPCVIKGSQAVL